MSEILAVSHLVLSTFAQSLTLLATYAPPVLCAERLQADCKGRVSTDIHSQGN